MSFFRLPLFLIGIGVAHVAATALFIALLLHGMGPSEGTDKQDTRSSKAVSTVSRK